jgi:hypothetical protein
LLNLKLKIEQNPILENLQHIFFSSEVFILELQPPQEIIIRPRQNRAYGDMFKSSFQEDEESDGSGKFTCKKVETRSHVLLALICSK